MLHAPPDLLLRRTSSAVFDPPIHTTTQTHPASPAPSPDNPPTSSEQEPGHRQFASSCVVSGGTGGNAICHAFRQAAFVLPISDDGGSSSEILRCLGGPSIGDIRSRLIRLAPTPSPDDVSLQAIIRLLSYRIPSDLTEREAKDLWREVVEGTSELWTGISADRREVLHRFFVIFESETLQRAHKAFSFINCSLGNVFLASAQRFFLSLPAAIFLFSSITQIPSGQSTVLPAILTNQTATIAAELENGEFIVGQSNLSHPAKELPVDPLVMSSSELSSTPIDSPTVGSLTRSSTPSFGGEDGIDSGRAKSKLAGLARGFQGGGPKNLVFTRTGMGAEGEEETPLESRIRRLFYINSYGQEIFPIPNAEVLQALSQKEVLIYSCGSLYTSIIPCLALQGMASAIATSKSLRAKVVLLNSTNDRETHGYTAVDYLVAIGSTLNRYDSISSSAPTRKGSISSASAFSLSSPTDAHPSTASAARSSAQAAQMGGWRISMGRLVSHLVCVRGCSVLVDEEKIEGMGVNVVWVDRDESEGGGAQRGNFDTALVRQAMDRVGETLS